MIVIFEENIPWKWLSDDDGSAFWFLIKIIFRVREIRFRTASRYKEFDSIWISKRCFECEFCVWLFDYIFHWQYRQFRSFQTRRKCNVSEKHLILIHSIEYWRIRSPWVIFDKFGINWILKLVYHFQFNRKDFNWFHSLDPCMKHSFS